MAELGGWQEFVAAIGDSSPQFGRAVVFPAIGAETPSLGNLISTSVRQASNHRDDLTPSIDIAKSEKPQTNGFEEGPRWVNNRSTRR